MKNLITWQILVGGVARRVLHGTPTHKVPLQYFRSDLPFTDWMRNTQWFLWVRSNSTRRVLHGTLKVSTLLQHIKFLYNSSGPTTFHWLNENYAVISNFHFRHGDTNLKFKALPLTTCVYSILIAAHQRVRLIVGVLIKFREIWWDSWEVKCFKKRI